MTTLIGPRATAFKRYPCDARDLYDFVDELGIERLLVEQASQ